MLDETDAIFGSNGDTEPLRALLNAGNRRGTSVPRCVGPTQALKDFRIFCPKVLAGIGRIPDTVSDRGISVRLERKHKGEQVERFRRREANEHAEPIRTQLAAWGQDAVTDLEAARPQIPGVLHDRAEESWEPLLAIADLAGGAWPDRARQAAAELSGDTDDDEDAVGVRLLRELRETFRTREDDRLPSAELAVELCLIETSPWGDIRGKALDARGLARRLRPFKIHPRTVRLHDGTTPKGYLLDQFQEAFSRHLDDFERHTDATRAGKGFAADPEPPQTSDENTRKPASANGCGDVADKSPGTPSRAFPQLGDDDLPEALLAAVEAGHITQIEALESYNTHKLILLARGPRGDV